MFETESFGAESQVAGGFHRGYPRIGPGGRDDSVFGFDQVVNETLDLGPEQVEQRPGKRLAHAADLR